MRYCINCGNELGNTKFCTKCGTKAPDEPMPSGGRILQKRFCSNCGAEMGNEQFCINCGVKATDNFVIRSHIGGNKVDKRSHNKNKMLTAIIMVVLVCAIGIGGFWLFGGRSYTSLVKTYVNASLTGDAKKLVSLMPNSLIDYIAEEEYDGDKQDMIFDLEDELESYGNMLEQFGVKASAISYKIINEEEMDEDDIKDYERKYREADLKIKKGKEVEIELTIPVDGNAQTGSVDLDVVKIGNSWYIIDLDM